jgi:hypothetical protein
MWAQGINMFTLNLKYCTAVDEDGTVLAVTNNSNNNNDNNNNNNNN